MSVAPISLSAQQFLALVNSAACLFPADRDSFVEAVVTELQRKPILDDGAVYCAIRECQSKFCRPEPEQLPARWGRERPKYERTSRRAF